MAHNGKNDKQQQGFQTTGQAAFEKMQRKFMAGKVTRQELAEFEMKLRNVIGGWMAVTNFVLDNVEGLRDKFNAALANEAAAAGIPAQPVPNAVTPGAANDSVEAQ